MNAVIFWRRPFALLLAIIMFATTLGAAHAQANATMPIGTSEVISAEQVKVDRAELKAMLEDVEVKEKLAALGVDPDHVDERINNLTPQELKEFNQQLDRAPAAAGAGSAVAVIVLFFLVFIVTDMLCATDLFNFVNCINRR